jgi:hypothetical protein
MLIVIMKQKTYLSTSSLSCLIYAAGRGDEERNGTASKIVGSLFLGLVPVVEYKVNSYTWRCPVGS